MIIPLCITYWQTSLITVEYLPRRPVSIGLAQLLVNNLRGVSAGEYNTKTAGLVNRLISQLNYTPGDIST